MDAITSLTRLGTLAQVESVTLTPLGATIMILSIAAVLGLVGFCMHRVLTLPPIVDEHLKCPLDIDTGDTQDAD